MSLQKREYERAYYAKNKERINARKKAWRKANPDAQRRVKLKQNYGLTLNEYTEMLVQQDKVCGICKGTCLVYDNLCVDHCHETGEVRGLLCSHCNTALGLINEDKEVVRNMMKYIENKCKRSA